MAWNGYFEYDSTEIVNSERTEALADGVQWFRALPELDTTPGTLSAMYGTDTNYSDPTDAPWYDPDIPESVRFYGAYPLDVSGIDGSTRASTPFENLNDGGTPGRIRHGIRSVVFSVALMGADEEAVSYGMSWLRRALLGGRDSRALTTSVASGLTMRYLDSRPDFIKTLPTPNANLLVLSRRLNRVGIGSGPTEPTKRTFDCGGEVWITGFTATVGNPFELGSDRLIFNNMPTATNYGPSIIPGTALGPDPYAEVDCSHTFLEPYFDPLCPPFINPPQPPSVPLGCYTVPASWTRFRASIPAEEVPDWGQVVPIVDIYTTVEQRGVRIRFYEDINADFATTEDPCNYVGDMMVSYIPAGATLRLDAVNERVVISLNGQERLADALAYGSDYKPFTWPSLTRGYQWVMVADFDDTGGAVTRPSISLTLTPRNV